MQNQACYFDEANHTVLLVYVNPVLPQQWSGQRGLPLLTAIVNLLYAAICLHVFKNVKGLCLWQSLHSPSWNMKAMVRLYHSTSLPKSSTHREARRVLMSLLRDRGQIPAFKIYMRAGRFFSQKPNKMFLGSQMAVSFWKLASPILERSCSLVWGQFIIS